MVFQDPFGSLNPRMSIQSSISEPMLVHLKDLNANQRKEKVAYLLEKVGLSADMMDRFPHEFSGGQRQRIGIARAISADPEFIICDEPVSALDVSVQAHIINLLKDIQSEFNLTYLFVAHDLAVVEHMSDSILVMTEGKIVEQGNSEEVCQNPQHPYTQKLLGAVPIYLNRDFLAFYKLCKPVYIAIFLFVLAPVTFVLFTRKNQKERTYYPT